MKPTNDPKYCTNDDGKICNVATSEPIPDDEPIFIFRAKDVLAEQVLHYYLTMVHTAQHRMAVKNRIENFKAFRTEHPDRVRAPDTVYPFPKVAGDKG